MFIDFLNGDFLNADPDNLEASAEKSDYEKTMENVLSKTSRLIIAGNSLSSESQSKDMHKKAQYLMKNFVAASVCPMKQLDEFLLQLTGIIQAFKIRKICTSKNILLIEKKTR